MFRLFRSGVLFCECYSTVPRWMNKSEHGKVAHLGNYYEICSGNQNY